MSGPGSPRTSNTCGVLFGPSQAHWLALAEKRPSRLRHRTLNSTFRRIAQAFLPAFTAPPAHRLRPRALR